MPTQLELEAQHRQEASEHNAQIATTKVTRGKADIFDGKIPASQLPEEPTFNNFVSVEIEYGTTENDLSQYEGYTIGLLIKGRAEEATQIKFPNTCKINISYEEWDGGWVIETNTLKNPLNLVLHMRDGEDAVSFNSLYNFEDISVYKINGYANVYKV
jgi:hypothetical protein